MSRGLEVRPWGSGYAVFDGLKRLTGVHTSRALAERALQLAEQRRARAARSRPRACLCCGHRFISEGPHNRLCGSCRTRGGGQHAAFAGV